MCAKVCGVVLGYPVGFLCGPPLRRCWRSRSARFLACLVVVMPLSSFLSPLPAAPVAAPVAPVPVPAVAPVCLSAGSGAVSWGGLVGRVVGWPPGVGGRRGWCTSGGGRVLVSVLPDGASRPVVVRCSVAPWGRPAAPGEVSALVASLRAAAASDAVLSFACRGSFSPRAWFCGVRPV